MKLGVNLLILMIVLNLALPITGSLPNNNAGFNFEPIKIELYSILSYAQNIATISPQIVTILPEINYIAKNANSLQENLLVQKQITSYATLIIGLVLYFYYTDNLDLTLIANDISSMLPYAQSIAQIVPQIIDVISQMQLMDPNINTVTTTEEQLAYIAMVMGYLTYFSYLQSPF